MPTVAIGGINARNVQGVLNQSQSDKKKLDGVAVVSAIISADDAKSASQRLLYLVKNASSSMTETQARAVSVEYLLGRLNGVIKDLGLKHPLCHNMTNLVVQNFAANVALAM